MLHSVFIVKSYFYLLYLNFYYILELVPILKSKIGGFGRS